MDIITIFIIIESSLCLLFLISLLIIKLYAKYQTKYIIKLVLFNKNNEIVLVYDKKTKRLTIPYTVVPNDKIPTQMFDVVLKECFTLTPPFKPNDGFHHERLKYDRIRDDLHPTMMFEEKSNCIKKVFLVYVLNVNNASCSINVSPYPDFFDLNDISKVSPNVNLVGVDEKIINVIKDKTDYE